MGLLERALKYKKQLNDTGRETLIDRIKGPAESGFIEGANSETVGFQEIDDYLLPPDNGIPGAENFQISEEISEPDIAQEPEVFLDIDKEKEIPSGVEADFNDLDEEIILLDDFTDISSGKTDTLTPGNQPDKEELEPEKLIRVNKPEPEAQIIDTEEKGQETDLSQAPDAESGSYHMPEFNDFAVLYEMLKEFTKADTIEEIFGTVIFSIMGQLGVTSVSIISPSEEDAEKWVITESTGIKVPESEISWEVSKGILEILGSYKGVIDVEDIKNDAALRDDYYRFISVNARLVTPIIYAGNLSGVILVGDKIDSAEFTPQEIDFLHSLSEAASTAIEAKISYEEVNTELLGLRIEKEILWDVDIFQNALLSAASIAELEDIIRKNFYSLGIESYSIFLEEEHTGDYYPAYYESEDYMEFADSGFRIKNENRLIGFLQNKKASIILDNFADSNVIVETFGRGRVDNMSIFISYPFIISGSLSGFISIFKINPAVEIIDVDIRLQRIVRFIFPYIYRLIALDPVKNRYSDLTEGFYSRLENELRRSSEMNIPVAVISFSVKNYKRFYDRFGKIEMIKMFDTVSEIVKSRLYTGDFSVRIDRNRFIIVLPGKDKKYCASFSTILKNEIAAKFNTSEFKLLVTFISTVFPEDGKDIFSLLEIID